MLTFENSCITTAAHPPHKKERLRLVVQPKKKLNFSDLLKQAATEKALADGPGSKGVNMFDSIFDKSVGSQGNLNDIRQASQEFFIWLALSATLGLFLAVLVNEIMWYSAIGFETVDTAWTTLLKIAVLSTNALSFFFLYKYYDLQLAAIRSSGVAISEGFGYFSLSESGLLYFFLIDLATLLPMPYPFIHFTIEVPDIYGEEIPVVYTSDNLVMVLMFARLQFFPRLVAEMWMMSNNMVFASARQNNVVVNTWFVIRTLLIANLGTLILLVTACTLASAYIVLILERPYPKVDQLSEFDNAIYFVLITMSTVGYGDISCDTRLGRHFSLIIAGEGVVFVALIIQGVVARVELSPHEARVVGFVETSNLRGLLRTRAACVCQTAFRQYRENCALIKQGRKPILMKNRPNITACLQPFIRAQRQMNSLSSVDENTENTHRGIDALQDRFDEMEEKMDKIMKALKIQ